MGGESPACSPQSQGGATGDREKLSLAPSLSPPRSVRGAITCPPSSVHLGEATSSEAPLRIKAARSL